MFLFRHSCIRNYLIFQLGQAFYEEIISFWSFKPNFFGQLGKNEVWTKGRAGDHCGREDNLEKGYFVKLASIPSSEPTKRGGL